MHTSPITCAAAALLMLAPVQLSAQTSGQAEAGDRMKVGSLPDRLFDDKRTARKLAAQILLDRAGFSPGVIDGYGGENTASAARAYQQANGMEADGVIDDELMQSLRSGDGGKFIKVIRLKRSDLSRNFQDIPESMAAKAEMDHLGYESVEELIAERYHMDVDFLKALNPDVDWSEAGAPVLVARAGPARLERPVDRIVVDRAGESVRAYSGETQVAYYPATVGSGDLPSPSGTMEVRAVAPEANYTFDPEKMSWGGDELLTLPPGPNNPVGGVWIDLTKEGYGIHGSPDPNLIGKTASHGCVRLTNWDANELADAVETGATVEFVG